LLSQVDKINAIKLQLSKFEADLKALTSKPAPVLKTISNMELLEEDLEKLKMKLQLIRNKVIDGESSLGDQVKSLSGTIEKLRIELNLNIVQMAEMAESNTKLEHRIEDILAAAKQAKQENDSIALQNLRIEYNQAKITLEDQSSQITKLKQEVDTRTSQLVEKEREILDLHGEIEELLHKADTETKDRISTKIRNSIRPNTDDDYDDPKALLLRENQELKDQLASLNEESETAQNQIAMLKLEIKKLNQQLFGVSTYIQQNRASIGPEVHTSEHFDFRGSEMLRQYREVEESLSELQAEPDNPYLNSADDSDRLFSRESITNTREVIVEKIVERIVEVPVEKIVERVVEVPIEVERIVEKVVERIVEVKVEVPVKQDGPSEREIEDRLKQSFEKDLNELKSLLEASKGEKATKEIMVTRLKETLEKTKQELEEEKKLRAQAEDKAKSLQPSQVDFMKNPYDDEDEPTTSVPAEGLKIELEILKSKLEQVKREFEQYKIKNPPSSPNKSGRDSFVPGQKQSGQTVPAELQISRTHIPINDISKSSIFINKEEEIETVLRTVQTDKQSIFESQDFEHQKPTPKQKQAETKKPAFDPAANLGNSIISKEQTEERKKILERVEMNMSTLMKSSLGQSSISGAKSDKNDPEYLLKRALREYNVLQIRIKELKKKNLEVNEKQEAVQLELQAGKDAQIEPKRLEEIEARLKLLLEEKEKHLVEYRGTAEIETQLRKKLMDLIAQVEEVEKKKQESERNQATKTTLSQSKLIVETPGLLEALPESQAAVDTPASIKRDSEVLSRTSALNLQVKHIQQTTTQAEPASKEDLEAKLKSKKTMNDKLSSLPSSRKHQHPESRQRADRAWRQSRPRPDPADLCSAQPGEAGNGLLVASHHAARTSTTTSTCASSRTWPRS